jgi:hypothetical protein
MQAADPDTLALDPGERAWRLELDPPAEAASAGMAERIGQFATLFLESGDVAGRFAPSGPLAFTLVADDGAEAELEALRAGLAGRLAEAGLVIEARLAAVGDGAEALPDDDGVEHLTEAPGGDAAEARATALAAELAAFREEMRAIAHGIQTAGAGDDGGLARFREELESVAGSMGQRVDGAAQRIESATDSVCARLEGVPDAARLDAVIERSEAQAALFETAMREALTALQGACAAMREPDAAASDGAAVEAG